MPSQNGWSRSSTGLRGSVTNRGLPFWDGRWHGRGSTLGRGSGRLAYRSRRSAAEEVHLLAATLDHGVEAEQRLEVVEVRLVRLEERAEVVPLHDVPALLLDRAPQQRRAIELVADEVRPFGRDGQEADESLVVADPGVPAQQRLAEHRGPLDLEEQRDLAADVPDGIDL